MRKIGITTTIPVEVIYASDCIPVDLNNIFITSSNPENMILEAERDGFPRTTCSWIKGIYTACLKENIKEVVAVMEGDCSNTHALSEIFISKSVKIIPFSFPFNKDYDTLKKNIESLIKYFKTSWEKVYQLKEKLDNIRRKLQIIDELTYIDCKVTGFENHFFLVNASDFKGDYNKFDKEVDLFIKKAKKRKSIKKKIRLGLIGVPPIITNLYSEVEKLDVHIVFNEVQRQFAMLNFCNDIVEQYLNYTYPYSVFERVKDINKEIKKRKIDGIIHYVQSFCFRSIEDTIFKKELHVPVITIEGDRPQKLDERTKIRLESFIDMLKMRKIKNEKNYFST